MSSGSLTEALRETLGLFDGSGAPLTTTEAAERLELGRRSTYERLERLVDRGEITTKSVGANGRVWWRPRPETADLLRRSGEDRPIALESLVDVLDGAEVGVFVLDEAFDVAWINEATERYFGLDREEVIGRDKRTLIEEEISPTIEDADHFSDTVLATYDDNTYTERFQCRVKPGEGGEGRWLEHRSKPIEHGRYAGGRVELYYDVTERRRSERALHETERQYLSLVDAVEEYAIFILDPDGDVQTWNEGAREMKGYTEADILGQHVSTFYTDEDREADVPKENLAKAAAMGSVEDEGWRVRADGSKFWAHATITAIYDDEDALQGFVKITRDMTERRERERQIRKQRDELESELEDVFDRISDAFVGLDANLRFTYVNDRAADVLDTDESALVGRDIREAFELGEDFEAALLEAVESGESIFVEDYNEPLDTWFDNAIYPSETGVSVYFRDVTERKERELRYEAIFDHTYQFTGLMEPDGTLIEANETARAFGGVDREEVVGKKVWDSYWFQHGDAADRAREAVERAREGELVREELDVQGASRIATLDFSVKPVTDHRGEVVLLVPEGRDITERKERERELEESEQRYRTLVENFPDGAVALYDEACHYVAVGGQMYDRIDLTPEDAVGMTVGERLSGEIVEALETSIERAYEGETETVEATYDGRDFRLQSLPIRDDDGEVILAMVVTQDVTERREAEEALESQREQLAALDNLNDIVRGITDAVIEQSTREEIEETVCERLADSDSYSFAWIGDVDVKSRTVNLRTEAGVEGYLDGITISVDPDDVRSRGPTGRAAIDREVQVTQNVDVESSHDPWREHVREHRFKSSAAIPIVHEDTLYGLLNVYAPRPNAFSAEEREVIGQLGEVIGHAIAAIERQRALTSDALLALEFQVDGLLDGMGIPVDADGTITLDRAVPAGGRTYLEYGTATGDAMVTAEALVDAEAAPHWASVDTIRSDGDTTHFEVKLVDPPVLSAVTAHGGYVDEARIEDGDYYVRIHLPPSASVRQVVDPIVEAYEGIELISQRQVDRSRRTAGGVGSVFQEALTKRQRAALEAGYFAGYFEWPRETKGETVAESLGISPATYHQHLRTGQRNLLGAVLDDLSVA